MKTRDETTRRRIGLIVALIQARKPLTVSEILENVPGYPEGQSGRDRFEKDNKYLREELGIALTKTTDDWDESVTYYSIEPGPTQPDIVFTEEESQVVRLAAEMWRESSAGFPFKMTLASLSPSLAHTDQPTRPGSTFSIRHGDRLLEACLAIMARQRVTFTYTPRSGVTATRTVEPWIVGAFGQERYLRGWDCDRESPRTFRLGRIRSAITPVGEPQAYTIPDDTGQLISVPTCAPILQFGEGFELLRRSIVAPAPGQAGDTWQMEAGPYEEWLSRILAAGVGVRVISPDELANDVAAAWTSLEACDE